MVACGGPSWTTAPAVGAGLAWDPPAAAPSLAGYRVYYGKASGAYLQPLGQGVDAGNTTAFTVTGLESATTYYFVVTAYDTSNVESPFSNEVFKNMP
jgi:hypothetical protein